MVDRTNELGQPIGEPVPGWTPKPRPPRTAMEGRLIRLEPIDADAHAADLFAAIGVDAELRSWTYLPHGPFDTFADYLAWMRRMAAGDDPLMFAVIDRATAKPVGVLAFMRIDPGNGVIEIGHVHFSPALQRTPLSTEAVHLMLVRAFDELGYRRCEWKCDSLNAPSRAAALRFGFRYEGLFRQALVYKGRNRDTTWYAMTDADWPAVRAAQTRWLAPENFDEDGRQRTRLKVA